MRSGFSTGVGSVTIPAVPEASGAQTGAKKVGRVRTGYPRPSAPDPRNATEATCIVSFAIGMVLFAAAMYSEVATEAQVRAEEGYRHGALPRDNLPMEDPPPHAQRHAPGPSAEGGRA
jgi:hypothetical protein